jgi:hypothetical protein
MPPYCALLLPGGSGITWLPPIPPTQSDHPQPLQMKEVIAKRPDYHGGCDRSAQLPKLTSRLPASPCKLRRRRVVRSWAIRWAEFGFNNPVLVDSNASVIAGTSLIEGRTAVRGSRSNNSGSSLPRMEAFGAEPIESVTRSSPAWNRLACLLSYPASRCLVADGPALFGGRLLSTPAGVATCVGTLLQYQWQRRDLPGLARKGFAATNFAQSFTSPLSSCPWLLTEGLQVRVLPEKPISLSEQ